MRDLAGHTERAKRTDGIAISELRARLARIVPSPGWARASPSRYGPQPFVPNPQICDAMNPARAPLCDRGQPSANARPFKRSSSPGIPVSRAAYSPAATRHRSRLTRTAGCCAPLVSSRARAISSHLGSRLPATSKSPVKHPLRSPEPQPPALFVILHESRIGSQQTPGPDNGARELAVLWCNRDLPGRPLGRGARVKPDRSSVATGLARSGAGRQTIAIVRTPAWSDARVAGSRAHAEAHGTDHLPMQSRSAPRPRNSRSHTLARAIHMSPTRSRAGRWRRDGSDCADSRTRNARDWAKACVRPCWCWRSSCGLGTSSARRATISR